MCNRLQTYRFTRLDQGYCFSFKITFLLCLLRPSSSMTPQQSDILVLISIGQWTSEPSYRHLSIYYWVFYSTHQRYYMARHTCDKCDKQSVLLLYTVGTILIETFFSSSHILLFRYVWPNIFCLWGDLSFLALIKLRGGEKFVLKPSKRSNIYV